MLKFIHTSDLQIGMTAPGVGRLAPLIQEARVESLRTVLRLSAESKADFLLIAGDLFDSNRISKKYVQQVALLLESSKPLRTYILPGNHDYYGPNSVYALDEFRNLGRHVTVFTESKPLVLPDLDLTLYPNVWFESRSTELPMLQVQKESGTKYHVAVLHGSIPSLYGRSMADDEYFPMDETALRGLGMDYIALGHYHSLNPNPSLEPSYPFYYSGTPEPEKFGEAMSGYVLSVELDNGSKKVVPVPTAKYTYQDIQRPISGPKEIEALQESLTTLPNPERVLVRLKLTGVVSMEVRESLDRLVNDLKAKLAFIRLDDQNLMLEPSPSDLNQFMRGGIAHTMFNLLRQLRDAASPEERPRYSRAISLAYRAFREHAE